MAANTNPIFELIPISEGHQLVNGDGTTLQTILTAGAEGSRIDGIFISSDDTVDRNLAFYINNGATDFYIGNVAVPAGSGYTTVVRVDALATLKPAYLNFLVLHHAYLLKCGAVVAITAAKTVTVLAMGGDF
jgi:hypothetical protein